MQVAFRRSMQLRAALADEATGVRTPHVVNNELGEAERARLRVDAITDGDMYEAHDSDAMSGIQ